MKTIYEKKLKKQCMEYLDVPETDEEYVANQGNFYKQSCPKKAIINIGIHNKSEVGHPWYLLLCADHLRTVTVEPVE